jgi:hypothetical protein
VYQLPLPAPSRARRRAAARDRLRDAVGRATIELLEHRRLLAAYHFSSAGSDATGDGSTTRPFRSVDAVRAALASGDRLYFRAGETFGSLGTFTTSGLTFGSYGRANNGQRATVDSGTSAGAIFRNVSNITVADLNFDGAGSETAGLAHDGIAFSADSGKFGNIRVDNVAVSGYGRAGVAVRADFKRRNGFNDVRISNATVTDGGDYGILVGEGGYVYSLLNGVPGAFDYATARYSHTNVVIENCTVARIHGHEHPWATGTRTDQVRSPIWGSGIFVSETRDFLIQRSRSSDNGADNFNGDGSPDDIGDGGPVGIWFANSHSGTIQFCESFDNHRPVGRDGGGFNLDQDSVFCTIQYNYSHGNDGGGVAVIELDAADGVSIGNVVRYNISENDARTNQAGLYVTGEADGLQVYHNTVLTSPGPSFTPAALRFRNSDVTGAVVRNNILVATGSGQRTLDVDGGDVTLSGNNYYNGSTAASIFWKSGSNRTLAQFRAAGQEAGGTGFDVDPQFLRPGGAGNGNSGNFRLAPTSPLIDAGVLGFNPGGRDFFGTSLKWGPRPDVGAVELVAPAPISAAVRASGNVNIAWGPPNGGAGSFIIERKTGLGGTWTTLARVAGDARSFLDSTTVAGGDYFYRIWLAKRGFTYLAPRELYVSRPREGALSLEHGAGGDNVRLADVPAGGHLAVINNGRVSYSPGAVRRLVVAGNAGNDTIDLSGAGVPATVTGGAGNDSITGCDGNDVFDGEAGDDRLIGGPGDDLLRGGDGNDTLNGGNGNDTLAGGLGDDTLAGDAGTDWADYGYQLNQVKASLNDSIDDKEFDAPIRGAVAFTDWIRGTVENLAGGQSSDVLLGNADANVLRGAAGYDSLTGLAGLDLLQGDAGRDWFGAADNERDTLDGGADVDKFLSLDDEDVLVAIP